MRDNGDCEIKTKELLKKGMRAAIKKGDWSEAAKCAELLNDETPRTKYSALRDFFAGADHFD